MNLLHASPPPCKPVLRAVQVRCFGMGMVSLDCRQESSRHSDVIDRVTQMAQHLRVATVTMPVLLDEWALVHDGPVKAFHEKVLAEMGLP